MHFISLVLALWLASVSLVSVGEERNGEESTESLIDSMLPEIEGTDMGKNLKLLENYYQQVNDKLNNKLKSEARDPFQQLVHPVGAPAVSRTEKSSFVAGQPNKTKGLTGASKPVPMSMRPIRGRDIVLPPMQFRGYMKVGGVSAALLDVDGVGAVVVKEGDKVGMGRMDSAEETVIRVVEINKLNVIVEVGSLGERVVVQ